MFKRILSLVTAGCFLLTMIGPMPQAQAVMVLGLPQPGTMVNLSAAYQPVMIKGLTVHKDNPFLFDFIVDVGQDKLSGEPLKTEGERLIKYFLAGLAIPDKDVWVNLSPYEKNRMIPEALGQTDMGRDLLEQDYILKQITASLIYPERDLGKKFWDKVYEKTTQKYGTTQLPLNSFNKVWIMADRAEVFERNQTAFVVDCHLKVMLEEDYLALTKHSAGRGIPTINSQIIKEIILPELEEEVNKGKNFATLRQIFNSIILSSWYKRNLKTALLNKLYADKAKIKGIHLNDPTIKEQIYEQYLKAYKKGVFNYIKEDINAVNGQRIPRKYFSGGIDEAMAANPDKTVNPATLAKSLNNDLLVLLTTQMNLNHPPKQQKLPNLPDFRVVAGYPLLIKPGTAQLNYGRWMRGTAHFKGSPFRNVSLTVELKLVATREGRDVHWEIADGQESKIQNYWEAARLILRKTEDAAMTYKKSKPKEFLHRYESKRTRPTLEELQTQYDQLLSGSQESGVDLFDLRGISDGFYTLKTALDNLKSHLSGAQSNEATNLSAQVDTQLEDIRLEIQSRRSLPALPNFYRSDLNPPELNAAMFTAQGRMSKITDSLKKRKLILLAGLGVKRDMFMSTLNKMVPLLLDPIPFNKWLPISGNEFSPQEQAIEEHLFYIFDNNFGLKKDEAPGTIQVQYRGFKFNSHKRLLDLAKKLADIIIEMQENMKAGALIFDDFGYPVDAAMTFVPGTLYINRIQASTRQSNLIERIGFRDADGDRWELVLNTPTQPFEPGNHIYVLTINSKYTGYLLLNLDDKINLTGISDLQKKSAQLSGHEQEIFNRSYHLVESFLKDQIGNPWTIENPAIPPVMLQQQGQKHVLMDVERVVGTPEYSLKVPATENDWSEVDFGRKGWIFRGKTGHGVVVENELGKWEVSLYPAMQPIFLKDDSGAVMAKVFWFNGVQLSSPNGHQLDLLVRSYYDTPGSTNGVDGLRINEALVKGFDEKIENFTATGRPGAGKDTLINAFIEKMNRLLPAGRKIETVIMGDYFRGITRIVQNKAQQDDHEKYGAYVRYLEHEDIATMLKGELIKDETAFRIINEILKEDRIVKAKHIFFNGFPRNMVQWNALRDGKILFKGRPLSFNFFLDIDLPRQVTFTRAQKRNEDRLRAGLPPRDDDQPGPVENRQNVYDRDTKPMVDDIAVHNPGQFRRISSYFPDDSFDRSVRNTNIQFIKTLHEFLGIPQDDAMASPVIRKVNQLRRFETPVIKGGIDLNTSNGMRWKISKDGKGVEMNVDPAMLARIQREGINWLSPEILKMIPVASIWPIVGLQAPLPHVHASDSF